MRFLVSAHPTRMYSSSYIETGYYPQSDISFEAAIENWKKIKKMKMPGEEDIRFFKDLFSQVYYADLPVPPFWFTIDIIFVIFIPFRYQEEKQ